MCHQSLEQASNKQTPDVTVCMMANDVHGYKDERFRHAVSTHFHCGICQNVLKEPVTCRRNEHYFCRCCICKHLENSSTCPTCQEELSQETISQAPQILRNCLDELHIRCDYADKGCQEMVQLAQLQNHVDECGFAPVSCSNEGCFAEVQRKDLIGHQQGLCEFRKCYNCSELQHVVHEINVNTISVNNQMKDLNNLKAINESLVMVKEEVFKTRKDTVQVLHRLEALEEQVRATKEMQEAMREAERLTTVGETYQAQNILVAGGRRTDFGEMKHVELFNLYGMSWSPLQQMRESRVGSSAFVFNNEITIVGGNTNHGPTETLTKLSISPDMKSSSWSELSTRLPEKLYGHSSVLCDGRDGIVAHIGGCNKNKNISRNIHQHRISPTGFQSWLPTPFMPDPRCFHGAQVFDNKVFVFGGRSSYERSLDSVISYDFKDEVTQLASLPYPMSEMATVRWGDNVILIGGADQNGKPLSTVVIYNVITERWYILPPMNEKRKACSAVVVQNKIFVMGGRTQNNTCLRSVECFNFNSYSWQNMPAMITARERGVAVAF